MLRLVSYLTMEGDTRFVSSREDYNLRDASMLWRQDLASP